MSRWGLADIKREDVLALVRDKVREGRSIEYKRELPGQKDDDKREFLADVASFANAGGGDLLFGIPTTGGMPDDPQGLASFDEDAERLRLESSIRDGIDPRIAGIVVRVVPGFPSGPVLVVQIPRSWLAPHMVTFRGSSRFFTRNSAGKYQMDVTELRSAFALSQDLPDKMRNWRTERLGRIAAGETPVPLAVGAKLVAHVIPASSFRFDRILDVASINRASRYFPPLGGAYTTNSRINIDGFLTMVSPPQPEPARSYCQVFRSGRIEAVIGEIVHEHQGRKIIGTVWYEHAVITGMRAYLEGLRTLRCDPPVVISLAILGAKGACLPVSRIALAIGGGPPGIDRDVLLPPDVLVEDLATDVARAMRPALDAVWNASGELGSPNYDSKGEWAPRD